MTNFEKIKAMSVEEMAEFLKIHVNTYQNWEDAPEKISIEKAMQIATILKVNLEDISAPRCFEIERKLKEKLFHKKKD